VSLHLLKSYKSCLTRFGDNQVETDGTTSLPVLIGEGETKKVIMLNFVIVAKMHAYNIILGRNFLRESGAIISMNHLMMKFPIPGTNLIRTVRGDQKVARECYLISAQGCGC